MMRAISEALESNPYGQRALAALERNTLYAHMLRYSHYGQVAADADVELFEQSSIGRLKVVSSQCRAEVLQRKRVVSIAAAATLVFVALTCCLPPALPHGPEPASQSEDEEDARTAMDGTSKSSSSSRDLVRRVGAEHEARHETDAQRLLR